MTNICDYNFCTACMACANTCTQGAISMLPDSEGFLRPSIKQDKCKNCGLCSKVCPVNFPVKREESKLAFCGWSKNDSIRMHSSSGGAFSEIALPIIRRGGVVFGCMLDKEHNAVHSYVETENDLAKLRGSKYVQSYIGDSFKAAKYFLNKGRDVLFSGTPCQIAGLKAYLKKDYTNLLTIDIVCHGVPSPRIWKDYIQYIEELHNDKIRDISFRSKKYSWIYFGMDISFEKPEHAYYGAYFDDPYIRGFLRDYFLRPSCAQCPYASTNRASDFTLADWWGYKKNNRIDNGFSQKGVSLILANSGKACKEISLLNLELQSRSISEAKKTNQSLSMSWKPNPRRSDFWECYNKKGFSKAKSMFMNAEKIPWNLKYLQKHVNSDLVIKVIKVLTIPSRFYNKFFYSRKK